MKTKMSAADMVKEFSKGKTRIARSFYLCGETFEAFEKACGTAKANLVVEKLMEQFTDEINGVEGDETCKKK